MFDELMFFIRLCVIGIVTEMSFVKLFFSMNYLMLNIQVDFLTWWFSLCSDLRFCLGSS